MIKSLRYYSGEYNKTNMNPAWSEQIKDTQSHDYTTQITDY